MDGQNNSYSLQGDIQTFFTDLLRMSTGATQHWILLTDSNSIQQLNTILRSSNWKIKKYFLQ